MTILGTTSEFRSEIEMAVKSIDKKCVAIVQFGPATTTSGMRPAEYYQVTIDPKYVSPSGEYIRFGQHPGDEIQGWQRIEAITICEILAWYDGDKVEIPMTDGEVQFKVIDAKD